MPKSTISSEGSASACGVLRNSKRALVVVCAALVIVAPFLLDSYTVRVLTTVLLFGVLASALNLIAGYTGYPAFGNVVFYGLGAYSTGIGMTRMGLSFWWATVLGVVVCAAYAICMGLPLFRLRGHYFAIATLGLNEATRSAASNLSDITGGGMGMSLPMRLGDVSEVNRYFYFLVLGILAAVIVVSAWMQRSRFGYGCSAIRFDEEAAASSGVPATRYKIIAWVLSAIFTGLAGSAYAYWFGFFQPGVVFDMNIAVTMFVMMLLGGAGTIFGPLLGAVVVEAIGHFAWSHMLTYHSGIFALVLISVVIFIPGGIMSAQWRSPASLLANIRQNRL